ncbi:hypothetical protein A3D85_00660 [Candidatus Amesbacteria bacterium RIFCSPHIGHO2_02_FULL_47_9]|uniref:Uncharacterized protein n=1 Tax=Candidatus Amesbacteria bacterium RIFCSPHIGHO2_01_FULL_48_32b TaxID=1797253 RepID=A0A1F4YEN7_9BACT|nr:MAG: hypothetical protein A2876_02130 [Candidatus Amesbacteria bacterium RIFCSPHIGHO2_01_FULL_48_32b]OGD02663.1 MAG: hypothetical protein A3D85_00660 [Candidatus Amesbacteria bacterium RIFCSPHIGHO2_02_FULL_47_9]OGD06941.1 MAG: hypothetical protein A2899_03530 [Candidatus Amesbacteria bacterium RIFCSPLOWO2_01_FULL_49_25]
MASPLKVIVFGPWVGEFSYEISWWTSEIRKVRKTNFSDYWAVHVGYKGREVLYKDFIDEYIAFPDTLKKQLTYPSMHGMFVGGQHIIPVECIAFFKDVINQKAALFSEVKYYLPGPSLVEKRFQPRPDGEWAYLEAGPKAHRAVREKLSQFKDRSREVVAVSANFRFRDGKLESKSWNPDSWQKFIIRLIDDLNLNVVLMGPRTIGNYPGTLHLKESNLLRGYEGRILDFVLEEEGTVEDQVALLKNTKCSIWGSTGAVTLTYFTQTPMFAHQAKEYGWRHQLEWHKMLTHGHQYVKIFDKYPAAQMFDSPVDEVFEEFKSFYATLP